MVRLVENEGGRSSLNIGWVGMNIVARVWVCLGVAPAGKEAWWEVTLSPLCPTVANALLSRCTADGGASACLVPYIQDSP